MKLEIGKNAPKEVNAFIEIPKGTNVKYELDEASGLVKVDRILHTAMVYPYNYGFIAGTEGEDGDAMDIMIISSAPFSTGSFATVRPIGLLNMKDEEGIDTKIMAVPMAKVDPEFKDIDSIEKLPESIKNKIAHFFTYYKSIEPGKWAEVSGWQGKEKAYEQIKDAIKRAK